MTEGENVAGIQTLLPEVLYSDTSAKVRAYEHLSHQLAAEGNVLGAVHAAWAANMHVVQAFQWERLMVASPAPEKQFFSVASTISKHMVHYARQAPAAADARQIVEHALVGLNSSFDDSALAVLAPNYISLDHLDGLPAPDAQSLAMNAARRLGDKTPAEVVTDRLRDATDTMAVAVAMANDGKTETAIHQAYASDLMAYEAYLIAAARAIGDTSMLLVDLRWGLACNALASLANLPASFPDAVSHIRQVLFSTVSPIEAERINNWLISIV